MFKPRKLLNMLLLVLYLLLSSFSGCTAHFNSSDENCPPWYYRDKYDTCICGNTLDNIVDCQPTNNNSVYLKDCYCMTLDPYEREPVVGSCVYTCVPSYTNSTCSKYVREFESKSFRQLENETCGRFNRQGVLCSQCMPGYGLPIYSYNVSCVPCKNDWQDFVQYVAMVYLPITGFVFLVIACRFSANSAKMVVYITLSQLMISRNIATLYLHIRSEIRYKTAVALYSVWNLELFYPFLPQLCLHPDLSALQVLALDYLVALYPIVLVLLTCFVVYWHGRSRTVVYLCKPIYSFLHHFKKEWAVGDSLVESFATLILLSYVKVMNITTNIVSPTYFYYMNGTRSPPLVNADPSVEYLSKQHTPYLVLAAVMSLIFNVFPLLLLCLYPCFCCQKLLNRVHIPLRILHTLMDAFRGGYRLKPRFLQSFTLVYILANLVKIYLYFFLEISLFHSGMNYVLLLLLYLVAVIAPYKTVMYNRINMTLIFFALLGNNAINNNLENLFLPGSKKYSWERFNHIIIGTGYSVLPLYGLCVLCSYLFPVRSKRFMKKLLIKRLHKNKPKEERGLLNFSLPYDREE